MHQASGRGGIYYPNPNTGAGTQFDFWNYGRQVGLVRLWQGQRKPGRYRSIPDPGVGIWTFSGAMVGSPGEPPTTGDSQCNGGCDPIDTSTGLFRHSETDLHLADHSDRFHADLFEPGSHLPSLRYRFYHAAQIYITNNGAPNYTTLDVVLPDGEKVHYNKHGHRPERLDSGQLRAHSDFRAVLLRFDHHLECLD